MISHSIVYDEKQSSFISSFKKLTDDEKEKFWEITGNTELDNLKKYIKDFYLRAQGFECPYCKQEIKVKHNGAWDTEHIIPRDTHPNYMFEPMNLCVSCKDCNGEKSNKKVLKSRATIHLPKKSESYLIVHPHIDEFDKHIAIIDSATYFLPKTDKGRKTIEICGLLRFVYNYSDYGNVELAIKQGILKFTQALLETSDPLEEQAYLGFIEDLTRRGKELSKAAFLHKFGA
ncbi:HNH endonuclease [Pantoea ananatis]|uniref:HNH endonuclease n=1 Tax=Pantoea ananas TaxID=553 RepID=UPI000CF55589|nr:HNH endonuclease domain-containing protein [Pantoea ananatis]PQK74415.1 HNH endonuclease [Pantoea ananatis]